MTGIVKSFDGQRVLHDVDFDLRPGEVHVLAGENGAGKSTLIKILGGVHQPDRGEIRVSVRPETLWHGRPACVGHRPDGGATPDLGHTPGGRAVRFRSPREAAAGGVAIIHQELSLVPSMSVADNLLLGREPSSWGWVRPGRQTAECKVALERLCLDIDPRQTVSALPISARQMIEIAKALARDATVIVMDEPTSALNETDVGRLFECIAVLQSRGCGIIYITHKLEEIHRIADRITVLRDGRRIVTDAAANLSSDGLIRHMVGRTLEPTNESAPAKPAVDAPVLLALANVSLPGRRRGDRPRVDDVSLSVRAGEILGLAGLQGSGGSDLLMGLFGAYGRRVSGAIQIDGRPYRPTSPRRAVARGLALVTNDRQRTGLVLSMDVAANVTLASLPDVSPGGWMSRTREMHKAAQNARSLRLRAASLRQPVATLSGGNQQKVVLAKWINTRPRVILLDEPTRGVDIGAKQEIYQLIRAWRAAGHAIILITSEMPELLMLSDRILVMHRGRTMARLDRGEATPERILHAAMGAPQFDV